jgi:hypothetical protein
MSKEKFIEHMLENGKTHSWVELANMFNLAGGQNNKGKSDYVRTLWRRHTKSHKLENFVDNARITKVKRWQDGNGEWKESIHYAEDYGDVDVVKAIKDAFKEYSAPQAFTYDERNKGDKCAIINLFDAHIDKMCYIDETDKNSSVEENIRIFEMVFDELLTQCLVEEPEIIYFPVGNDFYNTNGSSNTTKRGTPQDVGIKSEESFKIGLNLYRRCIDKAAQKAKVVIPVIKGNHDQDKVFYLGVALEIAYEGNPHVVIDNTRHQRKYYKYGQNLFGFAHGDKEKNKVNNLPLLMAEERKQDWADTTYREWYLGDIHHKQEYKFMRGKDFIGCMVRFLRSIGTSDVWHYDEGYIGVPKTAEAFIWKKSGGMTGNLLKNI